MNLFMYLPPHLAHPPGLIKNLVYGLLQTYYYQNSSTEKFFKMTHLLFTRLLNRGHKHSSLETLFTSAVEKIEHDEENLFVEGSSPSDVSYNDTRLFLYIPFHPRDISRQKIQDICEQICEVSPATKGGGLQIYVKFQ